MALVTGWDVGGAHLKAALIEDGVVCKVAQLPALIWTDLRDLERAFVAAVQDFGEAPIHQVTMTGELAEYFGSRVEGVRALTELLVGVLGPKEVRIFAGRAGFVLPEEASAHVSDIASANWYGTARVVGAVRPQAIFVDIGSSTSDVIPVIGGEVAARGYLDAERLAADELIYTGVVRTPVMAVAQKVPFDGDWQGLMAERFAVMADVYRILELLPEGADMFPAVDDRPKDVLHSRARLARMVGRDRADYDDWRWDGLARYLADQQLEILSACVQRLLSRFDFAAYAPLVGAGAGRFVVAALSRRLGRPYIDFADLVPQKPGVREAVSVCAPAIAMGLLED